MVRFTILSIRINALFRIFSCSQETASNGAPNRLERHAIGRTRRWSQALGQAPPASIYEPSPQHYDGVRHSSGYPAKVRVGQVRREGVRGPRRSPASLRGHCRAAAGAVAIQAAVLAVRPLDCRARRRSLAMTSGGGETAAPLRRPPPAAGAATSPKAWGRILGSLHKHEGARCRQAVGRWGLPRRPPWRPPMCLCECTSTSAITWQGPGAARRSMSCAPTARTGRPPR